MNDDKPSKYFGLAHTLIQKLGADAVFVAVHGGMRGTGCCPALRLDPSNSAEAIRENTKLVRGLQRLLRTTADLIEVDVVASGIVLEAAS